MAGENSDAFDAMAREDAGSEASSVHSNLKRLIREAVDHYEAELLDDQVEATEYYHGRKFGDEEEGRSQVVSTDVRDAIEAVMPSLLRIFLSAEAPCEYKPRGLEDRELAKQQTEAVSYIVREENDGFRTFMAWFDDALLRRIGAVKVWYDESICVKEEQLQGLTVAQIGELMEDETVTIDEESVESYSYSMPDPNTGETVDVPLVNLRVRRKYPENKYRFEAVPSEEFAYSPGARTLQEADCVVHRRELPASDLIAMGIPKKLVYAAMGRSREVGGELYQARQHNGTDARVDSREGDPAMRRVLLTEAYVRMNLDGDDIAERRKFQCLGETYVPVDEEGEIVDEVPFAVITPRPLAHVLAGMSLHDLLKDIQRIMSQIERGMLNSLALAIEPRLAANINRLENPADLLEPDLLTIIKTTTDPANAVMEFKHTFIGPDAMPVLEYFQHKKEERVGITKASKGLDADSLQSSTKQAVAATLDKAQERIEMIARAFAETGVKDLYKLLLRLIVRHQNRPMIVRLRGKYVEVDPRSWDATMDVIVNVGIGTGSFEERRQILREIAADHETHIAAGSPLVTYEEVRNVRARLVELFGFRSADEFYRPWGPEEQKQYEQQRAQAAQNQPQDPAVMLAQAQIQNEQMRLQMEQQVQSMRVQMQTQELQLKAAMQAQELAMKRMQADAEIERKRFELLLKDDRERDKLARETALKEVEIEAKNAVDIVDVELSAKIEADRVAQDADIRREAAQSAAAQGGEE